MPDHTQRGKKPFKRSSPKDRPNRWGTRPRRDENAPLILFGFHPVVAALRNPRRTCRNLWVTQNAANRLDEELAGLEVSVEKTMVPPNDIDKLAGRGEVHQGIALEVEPLLSAPLDTVVEFDMVLALDQITDPHNFGAILRSAAAFGAGAVITTRRHSAKETAIVAKAASGALDNVAIIEVGNLSKALQDVREMGFSCIGLDAEAEAPLSGFVRPDRLVLVLGAEGRGLRAKTRETCDQLVKIPIDVHSGSLNVSNAAAIAMYVARVGA